jgi:hypothetical protein
MKPSGTPRGWPQLPTELKLDILRYYLNYDQQIFVWLHEEVLTDILGPIISTKNRELVTLALKQYYSCNTFRATVDSFDPPAFRFGIDYPPPAYAPLIHNLYILGLGNLFGFSKKDSVILTLRGWQGLLRESNKADPRLVEPSSYRSSMVWHSHFTNLKTLEIKVHISYRDDRATRVPCPLCRMAPRDCEDYIVWLEKQTMAIKAPTVQTEIVLYDPNFEILGPCSCHDPFERLITLMATQT